MKITITTDNWSKERLVECMDEALHEIKEMGTITGGYFDSRSESVDFNGAHYHAKLDSNVIRSPHVYVIKIGESYLSHIGKRGNENVSEYSTDLNSAIIFPDYKTAMNMCSKLERWTGIKEVPYKITTSEYDCDYIQSLLDKC